MAAHGLIKDDGLRFQIVPTTRKVTVPPAYVVIGTVGDHNSEQLTFQCPKVIDGHDVAHCSEHYVIWKNVLGETGRSEITNITTDDENMYFTWIISSGVTAAAGFIAFTIHFEDKDISGAIAYKWSTTTCNDCQVLDTIKVATDDGEDSEETDSTYIPDGYVRPSGTIDIYKNGEYDVTGYQKAHVNAADNVTLHPLTVSENGEYVPNTGYGYSKVSVDVQPVLQKKTVTENGTVVPDSGFDGLSSVTVEVPQPKDTYAISMNGEYFIRDYEKVLVQVDDSGSEDEEDEELKYQDLNITENGTYNPDEGYDAISSVTVDVLGASYEEGDGISISESGVISVNVDGETVKLNKDKQLEAVTSIFNDSIVISTEDAVNIIKSAETVEYIDGNRLMYGSVDNQLIAQGYVIYGYNSTAPNGAINAPGTATSASGIPDVPGYDYKFSIPVICSQSTVGTFTEARHAVKEIHSTYIVCYDLFTAIDGTVTHTGLAFNHYNDTEIDLSILFFWDSIIPPGGQASDNTVLEFGGLLCYSARRYKSAENTYVVIADASPTYYIPFGSMAEYNAAVALTHEPTT